MDGMHVLEKMYVRCINTSLLSFQHTKEPAAYFNSNAVIYFKCLSP